MEPPEPEMRAGPAPTARQQIEDMARLGRGDPSALGGLRRALKPLVNVGGMGVGIADVVPGLETGLAADDVRAMHEREAAGLDVPTGEKVGAYGALGLSLLPAGVAAAKIARRPLSALTRKMDPLADLPGREKYLGERYRALGRISKVEDNARSIYGVFSKASPDDKKNIYQFLTDSGPRGKDAFRRVSPEMKANAQSAKDMVDLIGKNLAETGFISRQAYEKYRGSYLPRLYLKHILEGKAGHGYGLRMSEQGYRKGRDEALSKDVRNFLGEIQDPAFLLSRAAGTPSRDVAIHRFLSKVAGNEEWAWPGSVVQWRGRPVSTQWLGDEAARLRDQVRHMPEGPAKQQVMDATEEMEHLFHQVEPGRAPENYKQLPNSARYGSLRGMHVRKEIADDIMGAKSFGQGRPDNWVQDWLGVGGVGTKALSWWKLGKVALNPPSQARNFISNAMLLHLSGVPFLKVPYRLAEAAKEMAGNGKYWQTAKDYGVSGATFSRNELVQMDKALTDLIGKKGGPQAMMRNMAQVISDAGGRSFEMMEALGKTAKIIDEMKKGATPEKAALEAHKWLLDYSLIPQGVKFARGAPLGIPFATFYWKVTPLLAEAAEKRPWAFLPYYGMIHGMNEMAKQQNDLTDKDFRLLQKSLPKWIQDRGHTMVMPMKDSEGRWQAFDFGYMLPWSTHMQLAKNIAAGDPKAAMSTLSVGGPIADTIYALKMNINPFTKKQIYQDHDTPSQKMGKLTGYMFDSWAPTALTSQGLLGKTNQYASGEVDFSGQPKITGAQLLSRIPGLNVYPIDPEQTRNTNLYFMKKTIDGAKRNAAADMRREPDREKRAEIKAQWIKRIGDLAKELTAYAEESKPSPAIKVR